MEKEYVKGKQITYKPVECRCTSKHQQQTGVLGRRWLENTMSWKLIASCLHIPGVLGDWLHSGDLAGLMDNTTNRLAMADGSFCYPGHRCRRLSYCMSLLQSDYSLSSTLLSVFSCCWSFVDESLVYFYLINFGVLLIPTKTLNAPSMVYIFKGLKSVIRLYLHFKHKISIEHSMACLF